MAIELIDIVMFVLPFILVFGVIFGIVGLFWLWIKDHREKMVILYFDSEYEMRTFKKRIDDLSKVDIKGVGVFNLTKAKPVIKRTFLGKQTVYMVGQGTPMGLNLDMKKNELNPIYHPDSMKGIIESTMAKDMLMSKVGGNIFNPILILLAVGCGFAVCFILISAGVLQI